MLTDRDPSGLLFNRANTGGSSHTVGGAATVAAKPLGTLFLRYFLKSLDEKPRNFGSEHFSTCPNFHYLDILLSLKYLRHFSLTRNVEENLDPDGG